jgi:predicted nucleic-acid-binding protein
MRALDTNVLVDWVVGGKDVTLNDNESYFISHIVLAEFSWMHRQISAGGKRTLIEALRLIINQEGFVFADKKAVQFAFSDFCSGQAGFADYLILHDSLGHGAGDVLTFDRDAARHPSFTLSKGR